MGFCSGNKRVVVTERYGCINEEIVWLGSTVLQLNFDCIFDHLDLLCWRRSDVCEL